MALPTPGQGQLLGLRMCQRLVPTARMASFSIESFVACDVEMNLAWNLTERERLTLYYDCAEELGQLACF